MHYFAKVVKREGVFFVSFPDLENINNYGESLDAALKNAEEALNGVFESDFERGFSLPEIKEYQGKNYYSIPVLPHLEIAYTLRKLRNGKL